MVDAIEGVAENLNIRQIFALPLDLSTDVQINKKICDYLSKKGYVSACVVKKNVEEKTRLISGASFYFSGRLHSTMVAEALGVPTFSMSYSPKMIYYSDELQRDNYINIIYDEFPSTNEIINRAKKPIDKNIIASRLEGAKINFDIIRRIIDNVQ